MGVLKDEAVEAAFVLTTGEGMEARDMTGLRKNTCSTFLHDGEVYT